MVSLNRAPSDNRQTMRKWRRVTDGFSHFNHEELASADDGPKSWPPCIFRSKARRLVGTKLPRRWRLFLRRWSAARRRFYEDRLQRGLVRPTTARGGSRNGMVKQEAHVIAPAARKPLPARPHSPAKEDSAGQRNGAANLFVVCEPKTGQRPIEVTAHYTTVDFAH